MKTFINKLIACCCILGSAAIISSCHKKEKIVPVSSITISSTSAELIIGETLQLSATVSPSTATDKTVGWTSSNASIATVSPTGLVKAVAEGNCSITASCNGKIATCAITVKKPIIAVTSIELDKTDIIMYVGDEETLKATVKPDDATDKTITWGSSKTSVATVDNNGNVKAIADGVATITASCGGKTASCKVTVKTAVSSIELNETDIALYVGENASLIATVKPDNATDKTITWSSSNSNVATVDDSGLVKAIAAGSATITASCGGKSATCKVTSKVLEYEWVTLSEELLGTYTNTAVERFRKLDNKFYCKKIRIDTKINSKSNSILWICVLFLSDANSNFAALWSQYRKTDIEYGFEGLSENYHPIHHGDALRYYGTMI